MKCLIQWAKETPEDWEVHEVDNWKQLASQAKQEPVGGEILDQNPGWIAGICIQGVHTTEADHYYIKTTSDGGCVLVMWADDLDDWPVGHRWAIEWTFAPLQPDLTLGSAINTKQTRVIYAEPEALKRLQTNAPTDAFLQWNQFTPPKAEETIHGIWMSDAYYQSHKNIRSKKGWRDPEWTEHLPAEEKDASGRLKVQRDQGRYSKSQFTITYICRDTDRASGFFNAEHEDALERTTATGASETATVTKNTSDYRAWSFSSPSNDPNNDDWPSGSYRIQYDLSALDSGTAIGLSNWYRLTSDLGANSETIGADNTDFTTTGLHLHSASHDPDAGNASDRFAVRTTCSNSNEHGSADTITIDLNTSDSFADGPWTEGSTASPPNLTLLGVGT